MQGQGNLYPRRHLFVFPRSTSLRIQTFTKSWTSDDALHALQMKQRQDIDQIDCETCAHNPLSCIDIGGLNLLSRPHIVPAPAIPLSATGFYAFNATGFFWSKLSLFNHLQRTMAKLTAFVCSLNLGCSWFLC